MTLQQISDTPALTSGDQTETQAVVAMDAESIMSTYARQPIVISHGRGARLWDVEGREYLDFLAGIAVVGIGHSHPRFVAAITDQAARLTHISNLYHNELQARLARKLCTLTGMEKVFFCNSGAEANEAAIKIARKWGKATRGPDCFEIVTFLGSFHGRTMATVTATAQPKYQAPFAPLVPGFRYASIGDLEGLRSLVGPQTFAVMIEPIQRESGVTPVPIEFLRALRALCDEREVLLIVDEVQCGMGRTGRFLASQTMGITPDVVTMAKGIANGYPMGACLARGRAATTLVPGDHGSTFAGQPLACAAALATLDVMEDDRLLERATERGEYLRGLIAEIGQSLPGRITEVRGSGLMLGIGLVRPEARALFAALLQAGVIVNAVGDHTLRVLPPLIVSERECEEFARALRTALEG